MNVEILFMLGYVFVPFAMSISLLLLVLGEMLDIDKHDIEKYLEKRKERKEKKKK